jgi:AraC family transcriptional regulator, transcriptional activator FtrA
MSQRNLSTIMRGLAYTLAIVLVPLLSGVIGMGARMVSSVRTGTTPPPFTGAHPSPPAHDPSKRTAVIIAANSGTEGSDFLAPYEVLARSGAFNLYAVAPERHITHLFPGGPLLRGVDFVPHYAFAEYDSAIGSDPDLIVIPFLLSQQASEYQAILTWIRAHAGPNTILLSICAGAQNLADTGLLTGRSATTHHYTFPVIAKAHPDVKLVRGVRYVEDGNLISSAGVTAGVDATLFTLKRMLGREAALDVAQQIGYPYAHFLDDPRYDPPVTALSTVVGIVPPLANLFLSGYRVGSSQVGVALYEGISELALASVVDTYPHESTLTINTVASERAVVLSQHGLALVPRWGLADAPDLDRIILPGSPSSDTTALFERWAEQRQQPAVERIHQAGGYVYDVTFTDMARRAGSAVANQTVYLLEYPMGRVATDAPAYPLGLSVRVVVLALLGLGLAVVLDRRRAARKQRRQTGRMQPASAA